MNNTGILQKCLDELSKESPSLDYVRGMLEALLDMQEIESNPIQRVPQPMSLSFEREVPVIDPPFPPLPDLNKIKAVAEQSME